MRAAEELVTETPILYQGIHPGTRPGAASFLSVDAPDIVVEAVKQAEDGEDLIVRSYETAGHAIARHAAVSMADTRVDGRLSPVRDQDAARRPAHPAP